MGKKSTPMEWYNEICRRSRQRKVKAAKASQQDEQKPWGAYIPGAPCVLLESTLITGVGEWVRGVRGVRLHQHEAARGFSVQREGDGRYDPVYSSRISETFYWRAEVR